VTHAHPPTTVIPAQAGIQESHPPVVLALDSRLRGNDTVEAENLAFTNQEFRPETPENKGDSEIISPTYPRTPEPWYSLLSSSHGR
jgi:hypothetical protein